MATWAKFKFFYDSIPALSGSVNTATTTASGFDVDNLFDGLEITSYKANDTTTPLYINCDSGASLGAEELSNVGFETAGGGGADIWGSWTETAGDGTLANETTIVYSGTDSAKITTGVSDNTNIYQDVSGVVAGEIYELSFYTQGDGATAGRYRLYDVTNAADIQAQVTTGISASTWTQVKHSFIIPASCTQVRVYFYAGATSADIAYFDDISIKEDTPTLTADYIAIYGHNLNTIGASVQLQSSNDNFDTETNNVMASAVAPSADTIYLNEFTVTASSYRYWRLKITGTLTAAPLIRVLQYGLTTELDYASASFDRHGQEINANVNVSEAGYVQSVWYKSITRKMIINFSDADSTLYTKVKTWFESNKLKNFFVAYDTTNNSGDVYYMRSDKNFKNPIQDNGVYTNISISLEGRAED